MTGTETILAGMIRRSYGRLHPDFDAGMRRVIAAAKHGPAREAELRAAAGLPPKAAEAVLHDLRHAGILRPDGERLAFVHISPAGIRYAD